MPLSTDEKKYFDIREAPKRLRNLAEERERIYLGEKVYRTLTERGQIKEILDDEVKRIQIAFRNLVTELQAKRYSDQEAHERAWQSLLRNWPFALDDGEPEKKGPAEKESSGWPSVLMVTAKNGRRYVLVYQEPMSDDFKRFVRTLQGNPEGHDPAGGGQPKTGGAGGGEQNKEPINRGSAVTSPSCKTRQGEVRRMAKELLKKKKKAEEQKKQPKSAS
jgi:hypothetical protein